MTELLFLLAGEVKGLEYISSSACNQEGAGKMCLTTEPCSLVLYPLMVCPLYKLLQELLATFLQDIKLVADNKAWLVSLKSMAINDIGNLATTLFLEGVERHSD
jgi:hypothetical protein